MKFLVEQDDAKSQILEEACESGFKKKKYVVEGICVQTNVKNKNRRIYPKESIIAEINRYIREDILNNKAVGELNHPANDPRINYERVSHKFEALVESGDNWIGKAVVTDKTPMGSIVAGLMEAGVQMGISTRALGSVVEKGGVKVVQNDFRLISAGDIVSDPSAPDAYLTNLMEGKEWVFANGILVEKETEIKKAVNTAARNKQLDREGMKALFEMILSNIKE